MREILFRGKCNETCKYNGQWIEGFYGEDDGKPIIAHSTDRGIIGYFCDPDSIGQYTGLTDKNGKKIFEGDIVDCLEYYGEVYYDHEGCFDLRDNTSEMCGGFIGSYNSLKVVGNIHDNPELLEVTK